MNYTIEQAQEILRCMNDIEYFADTYIKTTSSSGVINIHLNDFQRRVIRNHNTKPMFFMPGARMEGKTTVAAIILLHQALFTDSRVSVVFARTKAMSDYVIGMIVDMYDRLPDFMTCVKMTTRNRSKIEFENLCSIISAGSSINYARGRTVSTIYMDESEWMDNVDEIVAYLYPCMAISPHRKIFALSATLTGDTFRKYGALDG